MKPHNIINHLSTMLLMFVPFAVILTLAPEEPYAVVGSFINLTCAANGTPPLIIEFQNANNATIDEYITMLPESTNAVNASMLSFNVMETGPMSFTCVVTNSTGHQGRSSVEVTGVGRLNIAASTCLSI